MQSFDVIIIGAGAAGLMAAYSAGMRGQRVLVLDHANKVGKKILMSGGGRCNFTNYFIEPECFLGKNPHFCKSALNQFTQWDLIDLVAQQQLAYFEKELGQLFCQNKAKDFLNCLLNLLEPLDVSINLQHTIEKISTIDGQTTSFSVICQQQAFVSKSLIVCTGGLSIPTMGATGLGYQIAEQFGHNLLATRASLVPLTWNTRDKARYAALSGIAIAARVYNDKQSFSHQVLFTHRGLSGPAILQMSNYWQPGQALMIDYLPEHNIDILIQQAQQQTPKLQFKQLIKPYWSRRWIESWFDREILDKQIAQLSKKQCQDLVQQIHQWRFQPGGDEGYRTAEVTMGGVDCNGVSSKTMQSLKQPGLFFAGEVLDVTGHLGGFNFQWAWASGFVAGLNC